MPFFLRAADGGTKTFCLHGVRIEVRSNTAAVADQVAEALQYKGATPVESPQAGDLQLDVGRAQERISVPDAADCLGNGQADLRIWRTAEAFYVERDAFGAVIHPNDATARIILPPAPSERDAAHRDLLFYLVTHSLVLLLRYRGWFALHTAALAQDRGRGLLLVATRDSGKSTTALNLVRSGWRHLSDDTVLLRRTSGGVRAWSFRRDFCVDPEAAELFPELKTRSWPPSLSNSSKWRVDMRHLYPGQFVASCRPRAIVLPEITKAPLSTLEPALPIDGLAALTRQSALLLTPERGVASRQLTLLRDLLQQASCYRLRAGRDLIEQPEAAHNLLSPCVAE